MNWVCGENEKKQQGESKKKSIDILDKGLLTIIVPLIYNPLKKPDFWGLGGVGWHWEGLCPLDFP